jgi:hypothetical protein
MLALALRLAVILKSSPAIVDMLCQDTMTMRDFASVGERGSSVPLLPVAVCRIDIPGTIGARARKVVLQLLQVFCVALKARNRLNYQQKYHEHRLFEDCSKHRSINLNIF